LHELSIVFRLIVADRHKEHEVDLFVHHPMHSISLTLYQGLWLASESLEEKPQGGGD
jgi:hypothetical protein